jgi:hypothetical protein
MRRHFRGLAAHLFKQLMPAFSLCTADSLFYPSAATPISDICSILEFCDYSFKIHAACCAENFTTVYFDVITEKHAGFLRTRNQLS